MILLICVSAQLIERLASTTNGSIIQMHGPDTIILKQDVLKVPPVLLTGVWYAPEAAHRLFCYGTYLSRFFMQNNR